MDQWMCNIPFIVFMISFVHLIDINRESLKGQVGGAVWQKENISASHQ